MKRTSLLAVVALVSGCAVSTPAERAAQAAQFESTIPTCAGQEECDIKWSAARRWVLDNAGFKIEHYAADYIETFNSRDYASPETWARVTREPLGSGKYRILVELGCNNAISCTISPLAAAKQSFNDFVNAAAASK